MVIPGGDYDVRLRLTIARLCLKQSCRGRAASIITILTGSIYYTWIKNEEANRKDAEYGRTNGPYERVALEDVERGKKIVP